MLLLSSNETNRTKTDKNKADFVCIGAIAGKHSPPLTYSNFNEKESFHILFNTSEAYD